MFKMLIIRDVPIRFFVPRSDPSIEYLPIPSPDPILIYSSTLKLLKSIQSIQS